MPSVMTTTVNITVTAIVSANITATGVEGHHGHHVL
jgi:hypothetical protein